MRNILRGLILMVLPAVTGCTMYEEMRAMKAPRYEAGAQMGAQFCAGCHQEIYRQWSGRSRHAEATRASSFYHLKDEFTGSLSMNAFMGEAMCYACHGVKEINEGVNCETCHGIMPAGVTIEEAHAKKFRPGLAGLKNPDFCARCHDVKNPVSGEYLLATHQEWRQSPAAARGVTCQACHMAPQQNNQAYHGFDTAVRDPSIYRDDLNISGVQFDFPRLRLTIENRITGHPVPAGGPVRTLALEVSFQDGCGRELHKSVQTFAKKFALMPVVGVMPYKLIHNTQLQSGEKRELHFSVPPPLAGKIRKAVIVLKMYEVSDEHQGNLQKAHWVSDPIIRREIGI